MRFLVKDDVGNFQSAETLDNRRSIKDKGDFNVRNRDLERTRKSLLTFNSMTTTKKQQLLCFSSANRGRSGDENTFATQVTAVGQ